MNQIKKMFTDSEPFASILLVLIYQFIYLLVLIYLFKFNALTI